MIGIIAAEEKEMNEIKKLMVDIEEKNIFNLNFYKGIIEGKNCVLVQCGEGKVNAARTSQIIIDNYKINKLINVGSAGAVDEFLNVKDIVIADKLVQYDFDISSLGYEKGQVGKLGKYFYCDKELIKNCKEVIENIENCNIESNSSNKESLKDDNYKAIVGTIATADTFCANPEIAKSIRNEFGAECVEMEGAAIAQVCFLDKIPFLVIRGISDTPNGNNKVDFRKYLEVASKQSAKILKELIKTCKE